MAAAVPGDHRGGRAGHDVGAAGAAAHVRIVVVGARRAGGGDRVAGGHNQSATTELVYRHQIVPALTRGAEVMDQIFG